MFLIEAFLLFLIRVAPRRKPGGLV